MEIREPKEPTNIFVWNSQPVIDSEYNSKSVFEG